MGKKARRRRGDSASAAASDGNDVKRRGKASAAAADPAPAPKPATATAKLTGRARTAANKAKGRQRFRLDLGDQPADREAQRQLGYVPVQGGRDPALHVMDVNAVRPPGYALVPRRPAWTYEDDNEELDRREAAALDSWKTSMGDDSYYERNLETWRQLWRVVERSDVLVLVVDIRFPALHFVPDLLRYVSESPNKHMLVAFNKCDLVSNAVREAWCAYFEVHFPQLKVVTFSSFPDAKLAPCDANSEVLSKRERRMAKSKLAAWGCDRLVDAVASLPIADEKKDYLEAWRKSVHAADGTTLTTDMNLALATEAVNLNPSSERSISPMSDFAQECREIAESNKGSARGKKGRRKRPRGKPDIAAIAKHKAKEHEHESVDESDAGKVEDAGSVVSQEDDRLVENRITIGMVGHPNVGKSSMINGIFERKVVSTSRTPGHTKHLQTMLLTPNVCLCDCPGLVFPAHAPRELQVLAGMYPISQVREPYCVVKYLGDRVDLPRLLGIDDKVTLAKIREELCLDDDEQWTWTAFSICQAWALKRGFRNAKSSALDTFRAANSILRMSLDGRIVLHTVPPTFKGEQVESWQSKDGGGGGTMLDTCKEGNVKGKRNRSASTDEGEWKKKEKEVMKGKKKDGDKRQATSNTFLALAGTDDSDSIGQ